jgi:organic hydroperoxide reductase OsmC/OhrA
MDMRSQEQRRFRVDLRHDGGYRFVSQASEDGRAHGAAYPSDEPDPVGQASAPATPALLGSALAHCLSASLLETLRHAHLAVHEFTSEATAVVRPNAQGLPRIDHVDVVLRPVLAGPAPRTRRCEDVFEQHCTVTSSVRDGIDVRVRVDWCYAESDRDPGGTAPAAPEPSTARAPV